MGTTSFLLRWVHLEDDGYK